MPVTNKVLLAQFPIHCDIIVVTGRMGGSLNFFAELVSSMVIFRPMSFSPCPRCYYS